MRSLLRSFLHLALVVSIVFANQSVWADGGTRPGSCKTVVSEKFRPTNFSGKLKYFSFFYPLKRAFDHKDKRKVLYESAIIDIFTQVSGLFMSQMILGEGINLKTENINKLSRSYMARNIADFFRNGIHLDKQISNRFALVVNTFYSLFFYTLFNAGDKLLHASTSAEFAFAYGLVSFSAMWPLLSENFKRLVVIPFQYSMFPRSSSMKRIMDSSYTTDVLLSMERARKERTEQQIIETEAYIKQLERVNKINKMSVFEQFALKFLAIEEATTKMSKEELHIAHLKRAANLKDIQELDRILIELEKIEDRNLVDTFIIRDLHTLNKKTNKYLLNAIRSQAEEELKVEMTKFKNLSEEIQEGNKLILGHLAKVSRKPSKIFKEALKFHIRSEHSTELLRLNHLKEELQNSKASIWWTKKLRAGVKEGAEVTKLKYGAYLTTKTFSIVLLGALKMFVYFHLLDLLIGDEEEVDEGLLRQLIAKFLLDVDPDVDLNDQKVKIMVEEASKQVKQNLAEQRQSITPEIRKKAKEALQSFEEPLRKSNQLLLNKIAN